MALVLVIDDEMDACRLMERIVLGMGHETHCTSEGVDALRWSETNRPDLVLLDIRLKNLDGIRVLERFREREPELKVIIVTGYPSAETASRARELGARALLAKPLEIEELERAIGECLDSP